MVLFILTFSNFERSGLGTFDESCTAGPSGPSQRKLQATLPMGIGARPGIQLMGIRIEMTKKTTAERSTLLVRLNETGGKIATGATQIATGQSTPPVAILPIAIFPLTLYLFPLLHQSWSGHVGSPDIP